MVGCLPHFLVFRVLPVTHLGSFLPFFLCAACATARDSELGVGVPLARRRTLSLVEESGGSEEARAEHEQLLAQEGEGVAPVPIVPW